MADNNFITSQVHTDATNAMARATGVHPMQGINRDFEEKAVAESAAKMGMGYIDIAKVPINPDHIKVIEPEEALKALIMPFFKVGEKLRLAIAHPTHAETQALLKKLKAEGYSINVNLASESGIRQALNTYTKIDTGKELVDENIIDEQKLDSYREEIKNLSALREKIEHVTAEEALNYINVGAIRTNASDIHYQPEENDVTVRFRIDGVLQEIMTIDHDTYSYIANQLKYKAGMKLNIDNIPQDGRYYFKVNKRKIDVRVSAIPTPYGESFVCRLLDSNKKSFNLEDLGYEGRNLALLQKALKLSNGMILITGPTGSGKTTTLYSLLNQFNSPERKIITLEDPIEYHIGGITQSQINEKRGFTFASGLRSILRQDPDVVMLGEIRDKETADTAAQAALTGHILLSTLHTNSAIETIPRLRNIGIKSFMIAPALSVVVAQRLVRKICPHCAEQKPVSATEAELLQADIDDINRLNPALKLMLPATLPHGKGCEECSGTGYLGQLAIAEVFENDNEMQELILANAHTSELFETARKKGMWTMGEDGVLKVLKGLTTMSEVQRVADIEIHSPEETSPNPMISGPVEHTGFITAERVETENLAVRLPENPQSTQQLPQVKAQSDQEPPQMA